MVCTLIFLFHFRWSGPGEEKEKGMVLGVLPLKSKWTDHSCRGLSNSKGQIVLAELSSVRNIALYSFYPKVIHCLLKENNCSVSPLLLLL